MTTRSRRRAAAGSWRRAATLCAALALAAVTGCVGDTSTSPPTDGGSQAATGAPIPENLPADQAALATVTLTGNAGTMPFFTVPAKFELASEVARLADPGSGAQVLDGHAVAVHVATFDMASDTITSSSYETGPELILADARSLPDVLYEALLGARVGARVLFGAPADGATTLYSFEVMGAGPTFARAEGTAVQPAAGLPQVTLAADGEPSMRALAADPPGELVVQPLIEGTGDVIGADSWLVVHYSNWLWDGAEVVSTWADDQPAVMRLSDAVQGWQEGLVGLPIGSQVLLIVPPGKAFGSAGTDRVPAGATLVFVIDILAGM